MTGQSAAAAALMDAAGNIAGSVWLGSSARLRILYPAAESMQLDRRAACRREADESRMTDDELMAQGATGDEEAFRALVARWERPVFAFLDRMLGSVEEAQDVGQETFLKVFQQARRYRPSGQFKSWIFRIAGNLARSRLRRRKIVRWVRFDPFTHDRASAESGADARIERDDVRAAVRGALSRLPERQRQAVLLRRYENMSYEDIAGVLNTTVPAVESLLSRAMATLRRDLAKSEVVK